MISNKKKLALLELPETKGVLFDALVTFVGEARGEEVDEIHLANMAEAIMVSLKRQYQPVVQSNPKQIDLEESIEQIKSHPDYGKQKKSLEADIDLEIIREFKDLMGKIKRGDSRGRTFIQMMQGPLNGEGKFTISEIKDRGLQIKMESDGHSN